MADSTEFNLNNYYTEFGGKGEQFFCRKQYLQLCDPSFEAKKYKFFSNYHLDQYQCVYYYEDINDIENCRLYGNLYFDLDGDIYTVDGFKQLKYHVLLLVEVLKELGLNEDEIEIYFSGAKGFHVIIPAKVLGIVPSTNLNSLYKAWAQYLISIYKITSIDSVIYDRKRLFRIPETTNSKTGLKKTRLSIELLYKSNSFENMMMLLAFDKTIPIKHTHENKMNKKAAVNFYQKSLNFYKKKSNDGEKRRPVNIPDKKVELLPCIKYGIETGAKVGARNNTLVVLASGIMQSGYKLEEALDLMHEWNTNNEKPLSFNEIELTVRSAYSMLLSGKRYGCPTLKDMGYCIGAKCKIEEKRKSNE